MGDKRGERLNVNEWRAPRRPMRRLGRRHESIGAAVDTRLSVPPGTQRIPKTLAGHGAPRYPRQSSATRCTMRVATGLTHNVHTLSSTMASSLLDLFIHIDAATSMLAAPRLGLDSPSDSWASRDELVNCPRWRH
jgi:hypothetical protein